ncbi:MAG: ACP S-malonyltransferase, partial [Bauldia sp.]
MGPPGRPVASRDGRRRRSSRDRGSPVDFMTPTTAVLFPGQGAQALGMAVDLVDRYPEARRVFDLGREILGFDVLAVCRDGPEAELASTRVSQPAIFLHSMAALEALGGRLRSAGAPAGAGTGPLCRGLPALAPAGLSLGEYSALVFAGSLELADAVRIVGIRGTVMQEACEQSTGAMAAVMGFPADGVEQAVAALAGEGLAVFVANYNSPSQTVISGELAAVDAASERLR